MASTKPRAMHADSPSQGAMGRSQDASLPSFDATTPSQQLTFTFATGIKNAASLTYFPILSWKPGYPWFPVYVTTDWQATEPFTGLLSLCIKVDMDTATFKFLCSS